MGKVNYMLLGLFMCLLVGCQNNSPAGILSNKIDPVSIKADLAKRYDIEFIEQENIGDALPIEYRYDYDNIRILSVYDRHPLDAYNKVVLESSIRCNYSEGIDSARMDTLMGINYILEIYPELSTDDITVEFDRIKALEREGNFEIKNPSSNLTGDREYTFALQASGDIFVIFSVILSEGYYDLKFSVVDTSYNYARKLTKQINSSIGDYLIDNRYTPIVSKEQVIGTKQNNRSVVNIVAKGFPNLQYDLIFMEDDIVSEDVQRERLDNYLSEFFRMFNIGSESDRECITGVARDQLTAVKANGVNYGYAKQHIEVSTVSFDFVIDTVNIDASALGPEYVNKLNYNVSFKNIQTKGR